MLQLQTAAANLTPWTAFCQHVKLNMKDEYQFNWLNEKGENEILKKAFDQGNKQSFGSLKQIKQLITERNWDKVLVQQNVNIVQFISIYHKSVNVDFEINFKEWDDNFFFQEACEKGKHETAEMLLNKGPFIYYVSIFWAFF